MTLGNTPKGKNIFAEYNGITVKVLEPGRAKAEMTIVDNSRNIYGKLHGGVYFTMADTAGGAACRTDGRKYVTLSGGLHFIHSAEHGKVTAVSKVRHRGRSTSLVDIEITDEDGVLLAAGEFTYFCVVPQYGTD